MNDSSLTAAVEGSAEQDSRVQTEAARYSFSSWAFCEHFEDGSYKFLTPDMENVELLIRAGELVRRANAYTEAVELLRDLADKCPTLRFPDDIENPTNDKTARGRARAFLAKEDTP